MPDSAAARILVVGLPGVPVADWLREEGYTVLCAGSGAALLRLAGGVPAPDLVLLNERVGEQDGLALLRRLQAQASTRQLPVLFAGGAEMALDEELVLAVGAADCLVLPLRPLVLLARVQHQLQPGRRAAAQARAGLDVLLRLTQLRDAGLAQHLRRTQDITRLLVGLARRDADFAAELDEDSATGIVQIAPLHDLGMVGLPDGILHKAGALTQAEAGLMRSHTQLGAEVIESIETEPGQPSLLRRRGREIARWHHERWDGRGYPDGLAGLDIPLAARIVGLADALAAMTAQRVYAAALGPEAAHRCLLAEAGRQFDPALVRLVDARFDDFARLARPAAQAPA